MDFEKIRRMEKECAKIIKRITKKENEFLNGTIQKLLVVDSIKKINHDLKEILYKTEELITDIIREYEHDFINESNYKFSEVYNSLEIKNQEIDTTKGLLQKISNLRFQFINYIELNKMYKDNKNPKAKEFTMKSFLVALVKEYYVLAKFFEHDSKMFQSLEERMFQHSKNKKVK